MSGQDEIANQPWHSWKTIEVEGDSYHFDSRRCRLLTLLTHFLLAFLVFHEPIDGLSRDAELARDPGGTSAQLD